MRSKRPVRVVAGDGGVLVSTITGVPVRRQPLPPGATDTPGEVAVAGMTDEGPVTAVIDVVTRKDTR